MLDASTLTDAAAYLSMLCADGYGGNLCAVCIPLPDGSRTAAQGNSFECGTCAEVWQVCCNPKGGRAGEERGRFERRCRIASDSHSMPLGGKAPDFTASL
eukprot:363519-Chlamydomonas_euryale.AAC.4